MSLKPEPDEDPRHGQRALLSELADGEADAAMLRRGCDLWQDDASARATWRAYHLIGDVMRSQDLASAGARDTAFLTALQTRLAAEPAWPAPAADSAVVVPMARRRLAWLAPTAIAAGFVAVAGVLVVSRLSGPEAPASGAVLASGTAPASGVQRVGVGVAPVASTLVIDGRLIRDAQLDAYLRAHRDMNGSATVAVPGGAMRSVETLAPQR